MPRFEWPIGIKWHPLTNALRDKPIELVVKV